MKLTNEQLFLKRLSDGQLVFDTKEAVKTEREATSLVVKYFAEIESRQLYLKYDCTTLFEFATSQLGYCAGSAQSRINAMRLVSALPEVEKKLETGELTLTAAAKVHSFFAAELKVKKAYTQDEKLKVVELCYSKSTREVDRELASRNPDFAKYESIKPIGKDRFEIKLTVTEVLEAKMRKLKGLLAHSHPSMKTEELLETLVELGLEKFDPVREAERREKRKATVLEKSKCGRASTPPLHAHETAVETKKGAHHAHETAVKMSNQSFPAHETEVANHSARYIPAETRHKVWLRNGGRGCEYESRDGNLCKSQHALQIDHVLPFARGGNQAPNNLRVLCAKHNRFVWRANPGTKHVRETSVSYGSRKRSA